MSKVILRGDKLSMIFGGLSAVYKFSFKLHQGELLGLIGPNGAGKTTVFNMVSGVYRPSAGDIIYEGEVINGTPAHLLAKKGIARTFQNIRLFDYLSCLENLKVAMNKDMSYGIPAGTFRTRRYWQEEKEAEEKALAILRDFDMEGEAEKAAGSLPYGIQRKLEIARAIATHPRVLLLDEPAAGMDEHETTELMETINMVKDKYHLSILLIEHDMRLVLGICDQLIVLNEGLKIAEGSPREVINDPQVVQAYLGSGLKGGEHE